MGWKTTMNNFILLGACFLIGVGFRLSNRLPENAAVTINGFIINLSLPALTLTYVHGLKIDTSLILPALMAWFLFGFCFCFFWLMGRLFKLSRATTGGLMLTGGLANTSFIGLPMIETFYGVEHSGLGILIDQAGSYFVLSTLGIVTASVYSTGKVVDFKAVVGKIVRFVPLQAFVLALILTPFEYPLWLNDLLKRIGATLVPLALVSVGYQMRLRNVQGRSRALAIGLLCKLAIAPAFILLLYAGAMGLSGTALQITVFEAAMGPMIGASIVAMEHELDPPLITLMVGIGIPLSFLTVPAWWYVLQRF